MSYIAPTPIPPFYYIVSNIPEQPRICKKVVKLNC